MAPRFRFSDGRKKRRENLQQPKVDVSRLYDFHNRACDSQAGFVGGWGLTPPQETWLTADLH